MKRYLFLIASCMCLFVSCDKDKTALDGSEKEDISESSLFHTWVYDHPEDGVSEVLTFKETGVFYYSSKVTEPYSFECDNVMGRYTLSENNITGGYELNGMPVSVDLTIMKLNDCELTLRANSLGMTFTYNKCIGDIDIEFLDNVIPNYSELISYDIISFSSHNPDIAEVDVFTGEISAVGAGQCYVDVITDQGTVTIHVNIKADVFDYSVYLGKTESEIRHEFGDDTYNTKDDQISYVIETGERVIFQFDVKPMVVATIGVDYNNSPSYDEEIMRSFLESKYYYSNDLSTDQLDVYMDVDGSSLSDLSFVVNILKGESRVVYNAFSFAPIKDHSVVLGRTRNEAVAMYGNDMFIDDDGWIVYDLSSYEDNVSELWLKNTDQTISSVIVKLASGVDKGMIHDYLKEEYRYYEEYSDGVSLAYTDVDETMVIFFDLNENAIYYMLPSEPYVKSMDPKVLVQSLRL